MSKKQAFISFASLAFAAYPEVMNDEAKSYWDALCTDATESGQPKFSDNAKLIFNHMKDHPETTMWKSRDLADVLAISSRSASGSMRGLVSAGYVEKLGQDPVIYSITELGKNTIID